MNGTPPQLDYSPQPMPWQRRRRARRSLLLATAGLVLLSAWNWGPQAWRDLRVAYWKRQCRRYAAPAERVAYDDDPARGALLLRAGGSRFTYNTGPASSGFAAKPPECWEALRDADRSEIGDWGSSPVVFLHERSPPGGGRRLLCVTFDGWRGPEIWQFYSGIYQNGRSTLTYSSVHFQPIRPRSLRLFTGQPDPADASHFTVGYELDGQAGTIDGWLRERDVVDLRVRDGPAMEP